MKALDSSLSVRRNRSVLRLLFAVLVLAAFVAAPAAANNGKGGGKKAAAEQSAEADSKKSADDAEAEQSTEEDDAEEQAAEDEAEAEESPADTESDDTDAADTDEAKAEKQQRQPARSSAGSGGDDSEDSDATTSKRTANNSDDDADTASSSQGSSADVTVDEWTCTSVSVSSTKDLSNVVLVFTDGTTQRFEDLTGQSGTFAGTGEFEGKTIETVYVKSGNNKSGDGPGYGEEFTNTATNCTTVAPARNDRGDDDDDGPDTVGSNDGDRPGRVPDGGDAVPGNGGDDGAAKNAGRRLGAGGSDTDAGDVAVAAISRTRGAASAVGGANSGDLAATGPSAVASLLALGSGLIGAGTLTLRATRRKDW